MNNTGLAPSGDIDLCSLPRFEAADFDVDFDEACDLKGFIGLVLPSSANPGIDRLKRLYHQNHPGGVIPSEAAKIPKTIHQIWFGGEMPEKFQRYRENWRKHHPSWQLRLWTENEVNEFEFENQDLFHETDCIGQRIDILRAEIISRFGGLYVDVDYDCFKPVDAFHHAYDFYGTMRAYPLLYLAWPRGFRSPLVVRGSLFGARPNHPILREYSRIVRENLNDI